ncbi:MAG TPA: cupredoxin domain-containing protein [Dehalococcoidales bacterium]
MKKHLIIVSIVAAALSAVLAYLSFHTDLIPYPASVERESIDSFVKILFGIASVFFAVIITVFVYSLIFFRQRPGATGDGSPIKGNAPLEKAWTLIPLAIVLVLAAYGGVVLNKITSAGPPGSEMEIEVTAQRFSWQFFYPAYNVTSFELYVPVNQRLHFVMQSKDVVHSFWVQEWGPKQDIVPGMTTEVRYTPNVIGQYMVECSQLCGYGHTYMTAPVFVTSAADFQTWVTQQQKTPATTTPMPMPMPTPTSTPGQPAPSPTSTSVPPASAPAAIPQTNINLVAANISFDLSAITVPAGAKITVNFDNRDGGVPHNFAVYTDSTAATPVFVGQIITGPATVTYTFTAPATPGNYFFRCDIHPAQMTGTLVVR